MSIRTTHKSILTQKSTFQSKSHTIYGGLYWGTSIARSTFRSFFTPDPIIKAKATAPTLRRAAPSVAAWQQQQLTARHRTLLPLAFLRSVGTYRDVRTGHQLIVYEFTLFQSVVHIIPINIFAIPAPLFLLRLRSAASYWKRIKIVHFSLLHS